jgi:hypothetical protein
VFSKSKIFKFLKRDWGTIPVAEIINITIFTYIKGLNLILSGTDTRKIDFRNNIYKNAAELYKKRLKIKNRKYC